jgi:hypothetical protein
MTSHRGGFGSAVPLETLRPEARTQALEEFEDRHGSGFLLHSANAGPASGAPVTEVQLVLDEPDHGSTAGLSLVVYPFRSQGAGHLVAIGRAPNNDVVIPESSISRFHAFLKASGETFALQDGGSTNGTTVNGVSVPAQGHGPAMDLKRGDNVRLGLVELTYLDAQGLREFLLAKDR